MRRGAYIIFSITLVLACCFIAGCSTSPSSPTQQAQQDTGNSKIQDFSASGTVRNYSFENVTSYIYDAPFNTTSGLYPNRDEIHIQMVSGESLDGTGNALIWSFTVSYQNRAAIVLYDNQGVRVTDWPIISTREEIFPDQVIPPRTLFEKNRDSIFSTSDSLSTESRDLVLAAGKYILTIKGKDKTRILVFDAKTGALTSSNDR